MFVGRQKELQALAAILQRPHGSALVYGKRKVGKTRLLLEAMHYSDDTTVYYECLRASLQENIDGLAAALAKENILPVPLNFSSFQDIFRYLNSLNRTFNIIIDEYPYLKQFTKSETVDSVFQTIIDGYLSNIRLFISGSHVGMMKDLLEEKNALYGRFSSIIALQELHYRDAAAFYPKKSAYDKIAFFSVFGGSPFVNEQLDTSAGLKQNICRTILNPLSSVYAYADNVLISDLAGSVNTERIFSAIGNGKRKYREIESKLGMANNGLLSKQLKTLLAMSMIAKVYPINKIHDSKKVTYELTDNLLRFWYSFVYKNKSALQVLGAEAFYESYIAPALKTFIAHRFEEIARVYFSLQVQEGKRTGILHIGTYYYDDSTNKKNGEFDVVLQREDRYDFYEVKYHSSPLSLAEMQTEETQIRSIPGVPISKIGFIATGGFDARPNEYECISADELYL